MENITSLGNSTSIYPPADGHVANSIAAALAPTSSRAQPSPYDSVPLPVDDKYAIRVLKIYAHTSGDDPDVITCKLRLTSLGDPIHRPPIDKPYKALSYRWSNEAASKFIRLNDHLFPIRRNLWNFLHQQQRSIKYETPYFWIDALCIDQKSNSERGRQVNLMGRIYSEAIKVLIWLGPGNKTYSRVFSFLRETDDHAYYLRSCPHESRPILPRDLSVPFNDPYWGRVWIVQECILAKQLELQCGSKRVPVSAIYSLRNVSNTLISRMTESEELEHRRFQASAAMAVLNARQKISIVYSLAFDHDIQPWDPGWPILGCSDQRDRIYALLGVMPTPSRGRLFPDYDMSLVGLYNQVIHMYRLDGWHERYLLARQLELTEGHSKNWPMEVKRTLSKADQKPPQIDEVDNVLPDVANV